MVKIIDGKALAKQENEKTAHRVEKLKQKGIVPGLAVILAGEDPASLVYVRNKQRKAEKLGIYSIQKNFPATVDQATLLQTIGALNDDPKVHGILVQEPLPKHLNGQALVAAIDPQKDVDGFHPLNVGKLYNHLPGNYPVACTPRGIITMLDSLNFNYVGAKVAIVGRSILVGRPMQALLINRDATVTMIGRQTPDPAAIIKDADLVIVATGKANFLTASMVKPGAVVIDVGINRTPEGKLVGDVNFEQVKAVASAITPVPGGVGPMTIASLMSQTVDLAEWSLENAKG